MVPPWRLALHARSAAGSALHLTSCEAVVQRGLCQMRQQAHGEEVLLRCPVGTPIDLRAPLPSRFRDKSKSSTTTALSCAPCHHLQNCGCNRMVPAVDAKGVTLVFPAAVAAHSCTCAWVPVEALFPAALPAKSGCGWASTPAFASSDACKAPNGTPAQQVARH